MSELIIQSRITSKRVPENVISRPRLLNLLSQHKNKSLILICSPAGYGKTTLVQDFLCKENPDYSWFHVTEDINNFYTFISYIIHALKKQKNDFGENSLEVIESLKQSMQISKDVKTIIPTVLGTFLNEFLREFNKNVFLVIDDLHNIESTEWLKLTFDLLFEDSPENLHIIITTRRVPDFNLSKLEAKRNMLQLEAKDLNFNVEEISDLLENIYSIKYTGKDIELLEKKINGWITGIHLILQAYGKDFGKIISGSNILPENIFDFFAGDIFAGLDENTRKFLISTSVLENFTPEICNLMLNMNNSAGILESLAGRNIFIESVSVPLNGSGGKYTSYNYHALFRQFLQAKAKEIISVDELNRVLRSVSSYYKENNDIISAVNYALMGKDYDEALPLIKSKFDELFNQAQFNTLWEWISALPYEYFKTNAYLLFYKGKLLKYFKGEIEEAYKCFKESIKIISDADLPFIIDCSIQIADSLLLLGKPEEALEVMQKINIENIAKMDKAKILYWLAKVYYRFGAKEYDNVVKILNESSLICEEYSFKEIQTDIYKILGNVYQQRGDFIKSLFYYEFIVKNEKNIYLRFLTITDIITLYSWSGNYLKAKDYLDEVAGLFNRFPTVLFKRNYLRAYAIFCFESGDYESSIIHFKDLIELELKSNIKFFTFWYYILSGECYYFLNKLEESKQCYELALIYKDVNDEYQDLEYNLHNLLLAKKNHGDHLFEETLINDLKYFEENNLIYSQVQIEFHLTDFYFRKKQFNTAIDYLSRSLNKSAEKQYISFLEQNFLECRYLFDFALANKIQSDFIRSIQQSLFEKISYPWLSDDSKKRLISGNAMLYDIMMNTFGGVELFVRGEVISDDKWIRKKSKLILVYLLLNQGMKFTKDKMMDMFFQELSPESAENIFHQSITNIRNVLKPAVPELLKTDSSKKKKQSAAVSKKTKSEQGFEPIFVIYEDKILRLNPDFCYKTDAVEFDTLYRKAKSAESESELKEKSAKLAAELYRGEFLAGYYEPWIEELRESYLNKYTDLCNILVETYKQKKMFFEVTLYAEKLLDADKLNEDVHIDLIESYIQLGNVNMAKNKFASMLKIFDKELGEKPSKSALDRINRILL